MTVLSCIPLFPKIVNLADNVIVLSAKHLTAYFRTEADPTSSHTLARCLKTKNWQDDLKIRSLERPNVVTGIAAAGEIYLI